MTINTAPKFRGFRIFNQHQLPMMRIGVSHKAKLFQANQWLLILQLYFLLCRVEPLIVAPKNRSDTRQEHYDFKQ